MTVMALFLQQFDEMALYARHAELLAIPVELRTPQNQAELILVTALLAGVVTEFLLASEAELNSIDLPVMAGVWQQYCSQVSS